MHAFLLLATLARLAAPIEAQTFQAPVVETRQVVNPANRAPGQAWSQGPTRLFAGMQIDVGILYLRPRFQLGWGQPHYNWLGVEANPIIDTKGVGGYLGARLEWPHVDLRAGGRYQYSLVRTYLARRSSYEQQDTLEPAGGTSQYLSLEAQLTGEVPWGPGMIRFELTGTYITGVPSGLRVFEETRKIVAEPPWLYGGELGYLFNIGSKGRFRVGPVAELIYNPGRRALFVRGGAKASLALWPHWEARATFQPPLYTPDRLGLSGGDSLQIGIRYRWATN